jgi:hypothetical protein
MGRLNHDQQQLFYSFRLDEAVPHDHPVRKIAAVLDLSWVHSELAPFYPKMGRPSIDPELMLRMLIIGYVFAIRSERAICRDLHVNLAYCRGLPTGPRHDPRRSDPVPAGTAQSCEQRKQVHRERHHHHRRSPGTGEWPRLDHAGGDGHRHRDDAGADGQVVPGVFPSVFLYGQQIRRHRARARDQPRVLPDDGRGHHGGKQAG